MISLSEIKKVISKKKQYLNEQFGVKEIGIFGSYLRNQSRPDSDVDILIELERPPRISLIGLVELQEYLTELLGIKVDLAIKRNLRKRIGKRILNEVEYL
jgi:predicted nucleotidyltransferase